MHPDDRYESQRRRPAPCRHANKVRMSPTTWACACGAKWRLLRGEELDRVCAQWADVRDYNKAMKLRGRARRHWILTGEMPA